ncbi:Omp85 superfamily domain [Popillia japonica]|uniref:Omp85 superfamily domain n=1 Tax=Popillia japonica TaxID=7064 RepID=A0AAW1MCW2_POPJA
MGTVYAKEKHKPIAGLPQPEINYDECEESKEIPLDAPVRVDYISVDGIARTHDDIVADATRDLFKSQNFRDVLFNAHKARLRLQSLGCFRNVSVHIDISHGPTATPEGVEVTFYVQELKRVVGGVNTEVTFYVQELKRVVGGVNTEVGHNEGSVVVGLRAPNTFGRGERVFVEYSYGSRRSNNFTVGIMKPFAGVTFYVQELKRVVGGVNTEVGHNEGSVVVGLRAPNTFGRGERVFVEYSYGSRRSNNFTVGIMKPFAGVHEPRLTASLFQNISQFPHSGYSELEKGFAVGYDFISKWDIRHALLYRGCTRDQGVLSKASSFEVREQSGATLKSALQHILTIDRRDDRIFPSCGSLAEWTIELAGLGGDNDIYLQSNVSVAKDVTLQGTLGAGFLKGLSNDMKIGMTDKFFLGGPLDIRGFQMRGIGPRSDGNALGGDVYWSGGLHLFTPLPFRPGKGGFGDIFRTHLFLNAGNISTEKSDESLVEQLSKNIRMSTGIGIAIRLGQMARVEINYCFPLQHDQNDVVQQGIQFGIGVQFA